MPRMAVDDNNRMNLCVRPEQKAKLMRAAALKNTDLTDFVLQSALREAEAVIEAADHLKLSERDSLRVLDLLEIRPRRTPGYMPPPRPLRCLSRTACMTAPAWREEAITRQHDRGTFDCGDEERNTFLKRYATTPAKKIRFTHQQKEAIRRCESGKETLREIARSDNVHSSTISRLVD